MSDIERWTIKRLREGGTYWAEIVDGPSYWDQGLDGQAIEVVPVSALRGAVEEAEKWKRIAQDRCTCVKTCGDTPEDSGGICKELPRDRGQ